MAFSLLSFERNKIKKSSPGELFNTEAMLPISEIRWDTIILKDWGFRGILRIDGVNLDLKNSDEQQAIIERYKRFLNGLDFPIQILIRNNYLDLTPYVEYMQKNVALIDNDALKEQGDGYISFLEQINVSQWLLYVKEFYIIVPLYTAGAMNDEKSMKLSWLDKLLNALNPKDSAEQIVARYRNFLKTKSQLDTRCSIIQEWLSWLSMNAERLWTSEIISLLFQAYNPSSHKWQSTSIS